MRFQAPQRPWLPRRPVIVGDHLFERGSGDVHAHVYPATAQVTGEIALAAPQDVDAAVQAARAACPAWRALPGNQRRDLLLKLAALLEQNLQPLAELLTIENGDRKSTRLNSSP